jgi:hypothetical protein
LRLSHLSHIGLQVRLSLHCFELLDEVLQLLLDCKVETTRVEGVDVHVVEPDQVLQVVAQAYLGRDSSCLVEVVY